MRRRTPTIHIVSHITFIYGFRYTGNNTYTHAGYNSLRLTTSFILLSIPPV